MPSIRTGHEKCLTHTQVIGAPSYFPTIWTWVKQFVDPGIVQKVVILPAADVQNTLANLIERQHLPKKYGGGFDFDHGMPVDIDPALAEILQWSGSTRALPKGPLRWIKSPNGNQVAVAVGTLDGKVRREEVAVLSSSMSHEPDE